MTFAEIKDQLQVKDDHLVFPNSLTGLPGVADALHNVLGSDQVDLSGATLETGDTMITVRGCGAILGSSEVSTTIILQEDQGSVDYSFEAELPPWPLPGADWLVLSGAKVKILSAAGDKVEGGLTDGALEWRGLNFPAAADLPDQDGAWKLVSTVQSIDLSSTGQIAQLMGLDSLGDILPPDLVSLGTIPVNELAASFTSTKLISLSATVGLLNEWDVVPGALAFKDIQLLAKEAEPAASGQKKQVKLLVFGTVAIGPVEVPITPENLSGGKTWEIKLNPDAAVPPIGLPDLFAFAGVPDLATSLPAGLGQIGGITLTDLDLSIDFAAKTLETAAFTIKSPSPWVLPDPNSYQVTNVEIQLNLTSPFEKAKRKIAGTVSGTVVLNNIPVTLNADFNEDLVLNGTFPDDLSLSTIASGWLGGTALPQDIPDITFSGVAVAFTPKKKAFSFSGKSTTTWTLPFGDGAPETSEVELHFLRDPEKGTKCLLSLSHSGDLPVSADVNFHNLSFGFDYCGKDDWSVVGSLKATAFNSDIDMQIGMKIENEIRTFLFKGILVMFPASLAGVASLNIYGLEVDACKELNKPGAKWDWSVSLAGVLDIEEVVRIDGKAVVEKNAIGTSFTFDANNTEVMIPLGIPEQDISLVLQLNSVAISRGKAKGPWTFTTDVAAGMTGLPESIQKYLPSIVEAQLAIDETGTSLTIPHLLPLVDFNVPDATVSGVGVKMGTTALEAANFKFTRPKGQKPGFSLDLGVGLPSNLNDTFGTQDDGTPKTWIFNTYQQGQEETITRFTVGISADKKVIFHPATLPFGHGGQVEPTYIFDFDEFGQLSIDVPSIQYDGKSFAASGGFRQPDPANHPLKVPLTPLKKLLEYMTLGIVARALPDGIPLKDVELVDSQGQFEAGALEDRLKDAFGGDLPSEVISAVDVISSELDRLPDAFKNYFHAVIPDGFHFAVGITEEGNVHIQLEVETPEGEPPRPIKFLTFGMDGVLPALNGVQLYSLSLDSVAGDSLQLLRMDAIFEQFDLLTLAASLAIPANQPLLPDASKFLKRWSFRNLYLLFALEAGEIIPIPIFFGDMGLEFYDLLGLGAGLKVQFPIPTGGIGDVVALVSDMKPFVTDAQSLLPGDLFARHNLALSLGIQPGYLELPPYLGGNLLGTQGPVFQVDLSDPLVGVLNSLKLPNLGKVAQGIVTTLPLQYRHGKGNYSLGGMLNVDAAYLLTTPEEFLKLAPAPVEATLDNLPVVWDQTTQGMVVFLGGSASIGRLAALKAVFGLALTEAGFATRVHVQGALSHLLQADLQGDMRITVKQVENAPRQTAFELNGHSRISLFDHPFLTGDLQMDDNHFFMDGSVQVFPDTSPLKVGGSGRLWIDREGNVSLNTGVDVSLLNFALAGAILDIMRNAVEDHFRLTATWLGAQASFDMGDTVDGQGGRSYQMTGGVHFPAPGKPPIGLKLDSGPVYIPGTAVKICDNLHIDTRLSADLAVTLNSQGFAASAHAAFTWNGKSWTLDFHIDQSFASLEDLAKRTAQAIIDQVYALFKTLWQDVVAWLKNVGSGLVNLATNEIGPALAQGWKLTVQGALAALNQAGSTAEAVDNALTTGFAVLQGDAAQLLKDAGFAAKEAAAALANGYNLLANDVAVLLNQAGYAFTEIAAAVTSVYKLTAAQLAAALKAAQFTVEQIASAVRVVFDLVEQDLFKALQDAGYILNDIERGVQKAFNLTQQELALLIAGIGATAEEAARKIQATYHLTYLALIDALRQAGYAAQEVASALKDLGQMARDTLAGLMTEAGYFAQDIAQSVKTLYNETAAGVAAALHAAGLAVRDAAVGIQAAFNLAPGYLVQVMKGAQYTALAIAQGLKSAFAIAEGVVASALKDAGFLFNEVAASVKEAYFLAEETLAAALHQAGYAADQVAQGIKNIFNSAAAGLASALKTAGYLAQEVAVGINTVFNLATNVMSDVLKGIGYTAKEIGAGLAAAYQLAAEALGNLMSSLGYTVNEVAGAVKDFYHLASDGLANAMRSAGYAYWQVAAGVQSAFNLVKEDLAALMKKVGYAIHEVADGVRKALTLIEGDLAIALRAAGYAINEIADSIKSLYGLIEKGIATALKYAGYAAQEVAGLLTNFYHQAADAVASLLNDAGYAANVIASVMKNAYTWAATQVAQFFRDILKYGPALVLDILKAAHYALDEIAAAMKTIFNLLEKGFAEALKAAGYAAAEVARLLTSLYKTLEEEIARILAGAGYALREVVNVMKNAYQWLADRLAHFFRDALKLAADVAAGLLKSAGYLLKEIVSVLNSVYQKVEQELAVILKGLGYAAKEVADAFVSAFHTIADTAAQALNAAGYLAGEIVGVLKNTYLWLADHTAQFFHDVMKYAAGVVGGLLKDANYLFDDIASALKSAYTMIDKDLAQALKEAGYLYNQVAAKVQELFNLGKEALAKALKDAGYALAQVASALKWVFTTLLDSELAAALKSAQYAFDEVASGVQAVFNRGVQELANVLNSAGYTASQVAGKLKEFFVDSTVSSMATVLKSAGYLIDETTAALQSAFTTGAEEIASALNTAGYEAGEIATVLKDTFYWAAGEVANFMKDTLGYGNDVINAALNAANYAVDEIGKAMSDAFGAAEDAVSGFFNDVGSTVAGWF